MCRTRIVFKNVIFSGKRIAKLLLAFYYPRLCMSGQTLCSNLDIIIDLLFHEMFITKLFLSVIFMTLPVQNKYFNK